MPAQLTTIADAVVTALNAATFSAPHAGIYVERAYRPRKKLEDMGNDVHCTVVQRGKSTAVMTRGAVRDNDYVIEIGVQRRINWSENADADAMLLLVEEIEDYFWENALTGTAADLITSETDPPYYQEHVEELQTFTAIIRLTYKLLT